MSDEDYIDEFLRQDSIDVDDKKNIEENIKIINNFVQNLENGFVTSSVISSWNPEKIIAKSIKKLLAEREEDKKRMAELKKENERLKAKIDIENWQEKTVYESLKEKYIPKQKVKKVIEELKPINFDTADDREYTIRILKEFLEED